MCADEIFQITNVFSKNVLSSIKMTSQASKKSRFSICMKNVNSIDITTNYRMVHHMHFIYMKMKNITSIIMISFFLMTNTFLETRKLRIWIFIDLYFLKIIRVCYLCRKDHLMLLRIAKFWIYVRFRCFSCAQSLISFYIWLFD